MEEDASIAVAVQERSTAISNTGATIAMSRSGQVSIRRVGIGFLIALGANFVLATQPCTDCDATDPAAQTQPRAWRFDADASRIDFHLQAVRVVRLDGRFERFDGEVRIDADGVARVQLRVDAQSLHMDNSRHRDWARSPEFFHVRRHPQIEFRSDPLPASLLERGGPLTGSLRVRGVEQPARFELAPGQCDDASASCVVEVAGSIRRSQFGMHSRRVALSDRVLLRMHFVLQPVPATAED